MSKCSFQTSCSCILSVKVPHSNVEKCEITVINGFFFLFCPFAEREHVLLEIIFCQKQTRKKSY